MANSTDPFGKSLFGGGTTTGGLGMTANEYVASKMGGYDWRGRQGEMMQNYADYGKQQAAPQAASEPSLQWRGDNPNQVMYNPGGGSDWSALEGGSLTDPKIIGMLRSSAAVGGPQSIGYNSVLSKVKPGVMQGIEGSTNSLAPEVLGKMWR
jgi:hypothetical protein